MRRGPIVEEPLTYDEKKKVAQECAGTLDMSPLVMVVDDMKNTVADAYAAHPDRLYLVDPKGKIAYAGGKGPRGFSPDELEDAIRVQLGMKPLERAPEPPGERGGRGRSGNDR